ncbi:hypothetical protein CR513_61901, partial [Mucuna pruriens]
MEEIRAQAEKHIEAKEDLANHLKVECQLPVPQTKPSHGHPRRAYPQKGGYRTQAQSHDELAHFTPLKTRHKQLGSGWKSGVNPIEHPSIPSRIVGPCRFKQKD